MTVLAAVRPALQPECGGGSGAAAALDGLEGVLDPAALLVDVPVVSAVERSHETSMDGHVD